MESMTVAMIIIAGCFMLATKLALCALGVLKARYVAKGSINALAMLEEDKLIDEINNPQAQAIERLRYKVKRDKLLSHSKVIVANAIAENR